MEIWLPQGKASWPRSSAGPRISGHLQYSGSTDSLGLEKLPSHKPSQNRSLPMAVWEHHSSVREVSRSVAISNTIAFQLTQTYPAFRSSLVLLLQSNPDVVHKSPQDQMRKFLVEPLKSADISTVIMIDAPDECRDEEPESAILLVLGKSVSEIPGSSSSSRTGRRCTL